MAKNSKPFILANNPNNDNSCECFIKQIPSADWIVVARYATMAECQKIVANCSELFMMQPIKKKKKMGMG